MHAHWSFNEWKAEHARPMLLQLLGKRQALLWCGNIGTKNDYEKNTELCYQRTPLRPRITLKVSNRIYFKDTWTSETHHILTKAARLYLTQDGPAPKWLYSHCVLSDPSFCTDLNSAWVYNIHGWIKSLSINTKLLISFYMWNCWVFQKLF